MFARANLHGGKAAILWGHQTAIELSHWRVVKKHPETMGPNGFITLTGVPRWTLSGTTTRVNKFYARQTPLLLTVPRPQGFFLWPVKSIEFLGPTSIRAILEQPEH